MPSRARPTRSSRRGSDASPRLRDEASGHADSLAKTMYDFLLTDADSVQATQNLLMWDDRDTPPVTAVGP